MEISDSYTEEEKVVIRRRTRKQLLWLAMIGMSMLFAGLTSAYVVRKGAGNWKPFELPQFFYYSSAVILASSFAMMWAVSSARKSNFANTRNGVLITLALGLTFALFQFLAWKQMVEAKVFFVDPSSSSGSFVYVLSGLHLAHLAGGLIALTVVLFNSFQRKYDASNTLGLELCATYWHFLDGLWIYLFLFLYFIH